MIQRSYERPAAGCVTRATCDIAAGPVATCEVAPWAGRLAASQGRPPRVSPAPLRPARSSGSGARHATRLCQAFAGALPKLRAPRLTFLRQGRVLLRPPPRSRDPCSRPACDVDVRPAPATCHGQIHNLRADGALSFSPAASRRPGVSSLWRCRRSRGAREAPARPPPRGAGDRRGRRRDAYDLGGEANRGGGRPCCLHVSNGWASDANADECAEECAFTCLS